MKVPSFSRKKKNKKPASARIRIHIISILRWELGGKFGFPAITRNGNTTLLFPDRSGPTAVLDV